MSRPVTIHSDGTGRGTIVLTEDGVEIENVGALSFSVEANDNARVDLEIIRPQSIVAQGDVNSVTFNCPLCQDLSEHVCDTQFGTAIHKTPTTITIIPEKCKEIFSSGTSSSRGCVLDKDHPPELRHYNGLDIW